MVGQLKSYTKPNRRAEVYRDSMGSRQKTYSKYRTSGYVPKKTFKGTGYVDVALNGYAGNTTGSIALLNTVAQGVSVTQRVGKKIMMKSLQIRGLVTTEANTTVSQAAFMIVYDRRPTGALPAITEILDTVSPNSFLLDANSARFSIVHRWADVNVGNNATLFTDKGAYNIDEYIKFPKNKRNVTYKAAATGAIADIDEGALYIVTCGGNIAGVADTTCSLGFRLRYWDTQG